MPAKPRIIIVEDNPTTARTLELLLRAERFDVAVFHEVLPAIERLKGEGADLVLLDVMLPDLDGLSACQKIREFDTAPIIMLTAKSTEDDIVSGLEAGANDYISKPFGSRELVARVRSNLRQSRSGKAAARVKVAGLEIDRDRRQLTIDGRAVKLTKSEFEIVYLLMANPGRVFTRDQIISSALGEDFDGFDRTVDTHIWNIRRKLGEPRGAPVYIHSEQGIGYRMPDLDNA